MSKRPTPKKRRSASVASSQRKTYNKKIQRKLEGKVDFMKGVEKNPRYLALKEEAVKKSSAKITKVKA